MVWLEKAWGMPPAAVWRSTLGHAPESLLHNIEAYLRFRKEGFEPEGVISDFESWAYLYGLNHHLPVISIDNMQIIDRCTHEDDTTADRSGSFRLAKAAVKIKLPGAYHYLISSFFFPPLRKPRTSLVPPILRPPILAAQREPGEHVLVNARYLAKLGYGAYAEHLSNEGLQAFLQEVPSSKRLWPVTRARTIRYCSPVWTNCSTASPPTCRPLRAYSRLRWVI